MMPNNTFSRRAFFVSGAVGVTGLLSAHEAAAKPVLQGLISAVFTPFNIDGSINFNMIPKYVDCLIAGRMEGLYVTGSTGEGVSLTVAERKATAEAFVKAVGGRVPVTVQVGANSLEDCRDLAGHAESIGVTAISANAPSYFTISNMQSLVDFMERIASSAPAIPFYYYHIPSRAKVCIDDMSRFLSLVEKQIRNFAGIKYTETATGPFQDILRYGNGRYEALWGCDEMLLSGFSIGANGGIGTTYALAPGVYHQIVDAFRRNDMKSAQEWQYRSWQWIKALARTGCLLSACRAIHSRDGLELGRCRLPLLPLAPATEARLFKELDEIGFNEWRNG